MCSGVASASEAGSSRAREDTVETEDSRALGRKAFASAGQSRVGLTKDGAQHLSMTVEKMTGSVGSLGDQRAMQRSEKTEAEEVAAVLGPWCSKRSRRTRIAEFSRAQDSTSRRGAVSRAQRQGRQNSIGALQEAGMKWRTAVLKHNGWLVVALREVNFEFCVERLWFPLGSFAEWMAAA